MGPRACKATALVLLTIIGSSVARRERAQERHGRVAWPWRATMVRWCFSLRPSVPESATAMAVYPWLQMGYHVKYTIIDFIKCIRSFTLLNVYDRLLY